MKHYDIAIIGAGPGGYVAGIRSAQYGKKVVVIEKEYVGGVCLNVGCIPSKAMIHASETFRRLREAGEMGFSFKETTFSAKKLQSWKEGIVKKLTGGIGQLLKANKIDVIKGEAEFVSSRELSVKNGSASENISFENAIVATGSSPALLRDFEPDGKIVVTSTEALSFDKIPEKLCVIGGGYIGLEIGSFYSALGSDVTVVEATGFLLPGTDPDLVQVVARTLKRRDVKVMLNSKAIGWKSVKGKAEIKISGEKGEERLQADKILVAVGRVPNTQNMGLEKIGVLFDSKDFIKVDERLQTNVEGIFAIGDCAGGPLLAHKASKEGLVAAGVIAGKKEIYDVRAMPAVIFTTPEIAYVGLDEAKAKELGHEVKTGKFPFQASGKALATGETDGFVKIVADANTDQVLGVFIVGHEASNLIGEACLAIEMGASVEDIARTVHPHPTLTESLMESAEVVQGHAIHIFQR